MSPPENVVNETAPRPEDWNSERVEYQAFARYARLTRRARTLERELKQVKQQMEDLSYQLRDYLGAGGYQRVRVEGFTIFLRRDVWVRAQDGIGSEIVCAALKASGMAQFVHEAYSVSSLTKHVRELEESHQEELTKGDLESVSQLLPPEVARVLNVDPKYNVIALETR